MRQIMEREYGRVSFPNFVNMTLRRAGTVCRTVSSCSLNIHWLPLTSRCGYCSLQYSAIARLGTDLYLHLASLSTYRDSDWGPGPHRSVGKSEVLAYSRPLLSLELISSGTPLFLPGLSLSLSWGHFDWCLNYFRSLEETLKNYTNFTRLILTYFNIRLTCI